MCWEYTQNGQLLINALHQRWSPATRLVYWRGNTYSDISSEIIIYKQPNSRSRQYLSLVPMEMHCFWPKARELKRMDARVADGIAKLCTKGEEARARDDNQHMIYQVDGAEFVMVSQGLRIRGVVAKSRVLWEKMNRAFCVEEELGSAGLRVCHFRSVRSVIQSQLSRVGSHLCGNALSACGLLFLFRWIGWCTGATCHYVYGLGILICRLLSLWAEMQARVILYLLCFEIKAHFGSNTISIQKVSATGRK